MPALSCLLEQGSRYVLSSQAAGLLLASYAACTGRGGQLRESGLRLTKHCCTLVAQLAAQPRQLQQQGSQTMSMIVYG